MLKKTDEIKVMRDPLHGYIHVQYQVIWDCINAKEFQRLRRIHQLGGDFQVYHTAEHSRFAHSLGVYEIVRRMIYEVKGLSECLSEYEMVTVMLAGLLHDIGHGAFSHAFESITTCRHEVFTRRIILEDSQIHDILMKVDKNLPHDVASIISYEHKNDILNQIVSGQLDADRMDYLLRDAYFTGTSYGHFDLERILRTMRVKDQRLVVKQSGIYSVENYIMARYHMYWQVYLHPIARSYEGLLVCIFKRMKYLFINDPEKVKDVEMFHPFLQEGYEVTNEELFYLDESAAMYGFIKLCKSEDAILRDLAHRILNRQLFEYKTVEDESEIKEIIQNVKEAGFDSDYYIFQDAVTQIAYSPYKQSEAHHNIWVLLEDGSVKELSQVSDIVKAVSKVKSKQDKKIYYPLY